MFIARDSDMIVFEHIGNKSLKLIQLNSQAVSAIMHQEEQDEEKRSRITCNGLSEILGKEPLECHLLFDVVFVGLFTSYGSNKENIKNFLE